MKKLQEARERTENLRTAISEIVTIAEDLDNALKSATKVVSPSEIRETATRISDAARKSATTPRQRG